jgi:outer membrane protein OmpA-like peptidoglycan-associated protein
MFDESGENKMRFSRTMTALTVSGALVATSACTTNPETGNRVISKTAIGAALGTVGGYLAGDVLGGRNDRTAKILGAGIGAIGGAAVGRYMDQQEAALRRDTAGTGVDVIRQGDDIVLRMPSGITFDVNRYDVKPQFQSTLNEVASTLGTYQQTYIDVLGHTDSTGTDALNQTLSERRAQAVASYLSSRGVNPARMATRGFGETQPIADNATQYGRAQNRRVEIKVVPFRGQ